LLRRPWRLALALAALPLLAVGGAWAFAEWRAAGHYRAGQLELERYHPREALGHLEVCLRAWPRSAPAHLLAARAARQAGEIDKAEQYLDEYEQLAPDKSEEVLLEWAMLRAAVGDLDPVEDYLRARLGQDPVQAALILEALTEGYLRMYRLFEAMACLDQWVQRQPDNVRALTLQGRALHRIHAYKLAAEKYSRVLERDAEQDDVRLRLADCLLEEGTFEQAARHLEELRRRQPDNPEVLVRLAFSWRGAGQVDQALRLLESVLQDRPDYGPALRGRGEVALQSGQAEEAEGWLRRGLKANPYDRQTHYLYYQCLERLGRKEEAARQKVIFERVEADILRLIEIGNRLMPARPHDPTLHAELGEILLRMGQQELAGRWLHSALRLDARHGPAHAALADYYRWRGDEPLAAQHRRLAAVAPPAPPRAPAAGRGPRPGAAQRTP
jgi:tetratricopeptide (TPR) repeat protein